ncbi:MAG: pantoate--beta-alanine ligase [Bdellovibrionales bacterium]|nr:pantoate--beta-alanine ligase [Bdellovibrionales bacterium]
MQILQSPAEVQKITREWGAPVALVPTMGALHAGHLSLVEIARSVAKRVVVSIFVNPLQFAQGEDLAKYPRTFDADVSLLREKGVDLLFAPEATEFYPRGFSTKVHVSGLTDSLCGASRAGHFEGVTTVCLKLFQVTSAQFAVFGEKDFQQLRVIEQMVEDLNLPLDIVRGPIVREADGLAMSSRNRYLSPVERRLASRIPEAIKAVHSFGPDAVVRDVIEGARRLLGDISVDYLHVCSEFTLRPEGPEVLLSKILSPHFFLAVKIGQTRLIDNTPLHGVTT